MPRRSPTMRHSILVSYFITCYNAQKERNSSPKKCGTAIYESVEIGAEKMSVILKADIKRKLKEIGLESGDNVIVHTSLKSMGYVCGGAQAVIEALIESVGENGTIMMPTQSWKNLDPETGVHGEVDEKDWPLIRENWPAYDKKMTLTNTMGAVAEMFRQWPGSVRSDHPARSICAWGKNAAYLTQNHDLSDIFGESSMARCFCSERDITKTHPCTWRMCGQNMRESICVSSTAPFGKTGETGVEGLRNPVRGWRGF